MRLVWISPAGRGIEVIEGDPQHLTDSAVLPPQGMVDLDPALGLVVCSIGQIGSNVALWWHHEINEVFGGDAFVVGIDGRDQLTGVPEGTWLRMRRSIEFLGTGDEALPRLRELVRQTMERDAPDPRQGTLALEPDNDLHR